MTKEEYSATLRRKTIDGSKRASEYRGVSRNPNFKKWQARLGKTKQTKPIYLGTFENEEEAAVAYDIAAIRVKGVEAITNFDKSQYDVNGITASEKIPIGNGVSRFIKENSANDVLMMKKRRTSRLPILSLKRDSSHQVMMNPQLGSSSQSLLASSEEQRNQINQKNFDDFSWPLQGQQNPNEFQTKNSSADANLGSGLGFSSDDGVLEGLLAMINDEENQQFTQQVLDAYPSSSLMKACENPSNFSLEDHQNDLQTNHPSFLNHQLSGDGSGSVFSISEGVSSDGILEGYTTMMGNEDEDFAFDDFLDMQQMSTDGNFPKMPSPQDQDSLFQLNGIHWEGNSKSSHDGADVVLAKD